MRVQTKRGLIRQVAAHWKMQYANGEPARFVGVGDRLAALNGETATESDVAAIIGHPGWTRNGCDECENESDITVQVGQEPDYESSTANMCVGCLEKAIMLAREAAAQDRSKAPE